MQRVALKLVLLASAVGASGCATSRNLPSSSSVPSAADLEHPKIAKTASSDTELQFSRLTPGLPTQARNLVVPASANLEIAAGDRPVVVMAEVAPDLQLLDAQAEQGRSPLPIPAPTDTSQPLIADGNTMPLDLPTAMSMVGGQHPAIGVARWRVQQAYAQLDQAQVLWLPSIQSGVSFHNHDGNYQASNGGIVDVHRNSFQYGLGVGAVGAGTTPRPGIVAQFHLADALFQPEIAEKTAWARGHAANSVVNQQLLNAALAYSELLNAEQDLQILIESRVLTADLSTLTRNFAEAGQGLQADADRLKTELALVEARISSARERVAVASARLAQALSLQADCRIVPLDTTVVPLHLVTASSDKSGLISTGLINRPELKEAQTLVAAACEEYRRQKYAPFVPSVLLGFSAGGFGGGLGNSLGNVDGRYDFDALASWEIRNMGLGERSARREAAARIQQAKFEKIRVMDQIAREISEASSQVTHRRERVAISERAIQSAEDSFNRNHSRIREGQGLPLEVLQSLQALEQARRGYLSAVVDYNQAQFQLQWATGWSVADID